MVCPEGQLIGRPSKPWKIGRLLGRGACGTVHELLAPPGSKPSAPAYAIKLAPLAALKGRAGTKRKKSAEERNADLIRHEYVTLQNATDLRGRLVPEIPFMGDPPAHGQTPDNNFIFLVMERMAQPLSEVVPLLLASHGKGKGAKKIPLGDVAAAMFDCLHAMHDKGNLFVDVKSENFMLSAPAASRKKASSDVGQRVRLIDFGLVERFGDMSCSKHREDAHPAGPLVGTPTYASLNVMSGHTCARRDDLEALGYVVAELILTLADAAGNGKRTAQDDSALPWSRATSDEEVYRVKLQEMDEGKRSKSTLFAGLKAAGADKAMDDYFTAVRGLTYAGTPDYAALRRHLQRVSVTVAGGDGRPAAKGAARAGPKRAAPRRTSARRSPREDEDDASVEVVDENVENGKASGKKPKVSVGRDARARATRGRKAASKTSRTMGTQTEEVIDLASSDDDGAEAMEWEAADSDAATEEAESDEEGGGIARLVVIEGPHAGEEVSFGGDLPDTVLAGRDPGTRAAKNAAAFDLDKDGRASGAHAKFVLHPKKSVFSVRVSDLSSAHGTYVNGSLLPRGKSKQAFVGDKIGMGDSVLQIRKVA